MLISHVKQVVSQTEKQTELMNEWMNEQEENASLKCYVLLPE